MRRWEYRTLLLHPASLHLTRAKGWRLKEVNEQEQIDWKKTEVYPSIADVCNHIGQQGWELLSIGYPRYEGLQALLYLKHLQSHEREVSLQPLEYRTLLAYAVPVRFTKTKGWQLKEINEQEQPNWKESEIYPSIADLCNQMDRQGWELTSVGYPFQTASPVMLYFKQFGG